MYENMHSPQNTNKLKLEQQILVRAEAAERKAEGAGKTKALNTKGVFTPDIFDPLNTLNRTLVWTILLDHDPLFEAVLIRFQKDCGVICF